MEMFQEKTFSIINSIYLLTSFQKKYWKVEHWEMYLFLSLPLNLKKHNGKT